MKIYDNYAYHYYDDSFHKFANLRELSHSEAVLLDHKFVKDKEHYLKRRVAAEEIMLSSFIKKGGNPKLKYAHYFMVGRYDGVISSFKYPRAIKILISCFKSDTISFTFGDSFFAFFVSTHPTKRKLYTVDEMDKQNELSTD